MSTTFKPARIRVKDCKAVKRARRRLAIIATLEGLELEAIRIYELNGGAAVVEWATTPQIEEILISCEVGVKRFLIRVGLIEDTESE